MPPFSYARGLCRKIESDWTYASFDRRYQRPTATNFSSQPCERVGAKQHRRGTVQLPPIIGIASVRVFAATMPKSYCAGHGLDVDILGDVGAGTKILSYMQHLIVAQTFLQAVCRQSNKDPTNLTPPSLTTAVSCPGDHAS